MDKLHTGTIKYFEFSYSGVISAILFIFLVVYMIYKDVSENKNKERSKYQDLVYRRNFGWAFRWFILIFTAIASLYSFSIFHIEFPYPFVSKVDGIIWLMTIVGIIGAIWAVFARIDAEKAFYKAEDARKESEESRKNSEKTLQALGTTFDFISFLDEEKLPYVIEQIGKNNNCVTLYLGFPCVGFLYSENDKLRMKPVEIFRKLINNLDDILFKLQSNAQIDFTLKIGYFKKELAEQLINNVKSNTAELQLVRTNMNRFYKIIEDIIFVLKEKPNPRIVTLEVILEEKFRFITLDSPIKNEKKAYTWVVSNLKDKINNETKPFDSVVFQTSEEKFVRLLEEAF